MGILDDLMQKATDALTPVEDKAPVIVKARTFKGTIYWGGAGLDGGYIQDQMDAFYEYGIKTLFQGTLSNGTIIDAVHSGSFMRYRSTKNFRFADESKLINSAPQFNMIGYSYGSLMAAQNAYDYASKGNVVDNLVLVASPISARFLNELIAHPNIGRVHVKNINQYDDPLFAGMSQEELLESAPLLGAQMVKSQSSGEGVGHFFYAANTPTGARRRRALAIEIKNMGLK
jgi:hypothetical protein